MVLKRKKRISKKIKKEPKKISSKYSSSNERSPIRSETKRGVWGVVMIAFASLFSLAAFDMAGIFGEKLYEILGALFGVGYILLPLSLVLLAIALFRSFEQNFGMSKTIGSVIFFFSGLAMIETLFPGKGGLLGLVLSTPLVWAVDVVATVIALLALIVVALLLVLDTHPKFAFPSISKIFKRKERTDEETDTILGEREESLIEKETQKMSLKSQKDTDESSDKNFQKEAPKKTQSIINFAAAKGSEVIDDFLIKGHVGETYTPPPIKLLKKDSGRPSVGDVKANANSIKRTLQNFGISVEMDEVSIGPTVTRYSLKPAEGVRLTRILSLQSNLELALAASPIRIEAPIPGKALVGIEVPNTSKATLGLAALFSNKGFQNPKLKLPAALGRDITGQPHYIDLSKMPHMLIAGATGAGKSVTIHDLIVSLLYRNGPDKMRLVMVDPKRVELTLYNGIPHLLTPVITDAKKAILALKWLTKEMERRYDILEGNAVRDIASYHKNIMEPALAAQAKSDASDSEEKKIEPMPYIVAFLDELADLMQAYPREFESGIVRLAQMSRAVGIHLVLATQRPDVKTITGLIKANIPARLALQVASQIDSRTILDMGGAEKLLGAGDMLFLSGEMSKPVRVQAPFVSESEVKAVVKHIVKAYEEELPDEINLEDVGKESVLFSSSVGASTGGDEDELYEDAKQTVIDAGKASTSYIQRKLRVGYARAARLMDMLEEHGVIGPADGSKARSILIADEDGDEEDADDYDEEETFNEENR